MSHNLDMDELSVLFKAHTAGQDRFTRRMAISMAALDGSTPKAMVLRLERLRLLRPGAWQWFAMNGGITSEQIAEVREIAPTLSGLSHG